MDKENIIVRFVSGKFIPFIQLFGLYVIMHGEVGPGGGFQGGVILGASMILYGLVFGYDAVRKKFSQKVGDVFSSVGVLLFAGIGLLTLMIGGHYLEYRVLPLGSPQFSSHIGILGIEIGVGITVASVMTILFFEMARKKS